jgi:pSer/pThr/pTyr-binding forkhead associated (FHA) protein
MIENSTEERHGLKGPHRHPDTGEALPVEFEPLRLELHDLESEPQQVVLEVARPSAVLGRHTCADIRFANPEVSRRHCRLSFQQGFWRIVDLDSLNGLFVNGERIHEVVLRKGDTIRLGRVTMSVLTSTNQQNDPPYGPSPQTDVNPQQPPNSPPLAA